MAFDRGSRLPFPPFNPSIAEVFFRAGFIESWGRGIDTIVNLSTAYGNDAPKFSNELGGLEVNFFSKKLEGYLPEGYKNVAGKSSEESSEKGSEEKWRFLGESSEKIITQMGVNPKVTIRELSEHLNLTTRAIEKQIKMLKGIGKIKRKGSTKSGYWEVIK